MAAAFNSHLDLSTSPLQANSLTHPDFSLGSLASGFSTPNRPRLQAPSASSRTTAASSAPVATPSPPGTSTLNATSTYVPSSRRSYGGIGSTSVADRLGDDDGEGDGVNETAGADLLDTPGVGDKKGTWEVKKRPRSGTLTAGSSTTAVSTSAASSKLSKLTLRDQEKHIDNLKKENFSIKLRVHFLEDQLARLAPDQMEAALKQNINLKIEVQQRGMEIKKLKKLVLSLEHELERLQRGGAGSSSGASARERELEERLEERELELRELRRRRAEREEDDDEILREAEAHNAELEGELENARGLIEENIDEIERLRELVERQGEQPPNRSNDLSSSTSRNALQHRLEELEDENADLREKFTGQEDLIAQLQDDKDDLVDSLHATQLQLEDLQQRRHAESLERSASRAALLNEQEEREELEEDVNRLRDRVAGLMIELQTKEEELERAKREVDDIIEEHKRIVEVVENEWKGEVEEARGQNEELKDVLAERDAESEELRLHVSELEATNNEIHAKYEGAITQLEEELEERQRDLEDRDRDAEEREVEIERREVELEAMRGTVDKLGEQIYVLEDENDRFKEIRDEEGLERERLEGVVAGLKEKNASLKEEVQDLTDAFEQSKQDVHLHLTRQEELAQHVEALVSELEAERSERKNIDSRLASTTKELETQVRQSKRALEAKESALQGALADLARAEKRLGEREQDLSQVQSALQQTERESKKLGESATTTRFSLQLELDRLKRDLERAEDELARLRTELTAKEASYREREGTLDRLHAENRDLASQLAAQTQARLNLGEKLDTVQKGAKEKEVEAGALKEKVAELEGRLSKDQRALLQAEGMYRDQLTERNTLLLTIYQYMDKILGVDKTPKKGNAAETKPFTNFGVFHDNLITRLKALSHIQVEFERKTKEIEGRFADRLAEMRKQLETRWKQIDKFEANVKVLAEAKAQWRRKLSAKEGELEAVKGTNSDLAAQLNILKRPTSSSDSVVRSLDIRATNAERRLNNTQNQLAASEEKIALLSQKNLAADEKWEARVKEYEARLKSAEERVKRERQGGKERVAELERLVQSLQRQRDLAQKRSNQLDDVLENANPANKPSSTPNPHR